MPEKTYKEIRVEWQEASKELTGIVQEFNTHMVFDNVSDYVLDMADEIRRLRERVEVLRDLRTPDPEPDTTDEQVDECLGAIQSRLTVLEDRAEEGEKVTCRLEDKLNIVTGDLHDRVKALETRGSVPEDRGSEPEDRGAFFWHNHGWNAALRGLLAEGFWSDRDEERFNEKIREVRIKPESAESKPEPDTVVDNQRLRRDESKFYVDDEIANPRDQSIYDFGRASGREAAAEDADGHRRQGWNAALEGLLEDSRWGNIPRAFIKGRIK